MMDKNPPLFLSTEDTIDPDQSSRLARNLHHASLPVVPADHFSAPPVPMFSSILESLSLVSTSEVWLFGCNSSMKTTSGWTSVDIRWVYLGPNGFYQLCGGDSAGHLQMLKGSKLVCLSSAALSFLGQPLSLQSSTLLVCASSKELEQHILKPQSALKSLPGGDLAVAK
ncbi:hypothetical protein AB205_0098810 [Aquarana catesbeiana]|uniref:Uncharacterized protein n=1 Tax=Aquarana catesbeiana TaxID=8400 RepID=A0A2G9RLW5_AQUCT|nr:hypothetical protein AB205_0098810 [Aquarana catesbeiana]